MDSKSDSFSNSPHAIIIIRGNKLVHLSNQVAKIVGCPIEELMEKDLDQLLLYFSPSDARRIHRLVRKAAEGELVEPETSLCIRSTAGDCTWIDLMVSFTSYQNEPALLMVWFDTTTRSTVEDELRQSIWRLQILHDIDHAILSLENKEETASVALQHISYMVPDYLASAVFILDEHSNQFELIAFDSILEDSGRLRNVLKEAFLSNSFTNSGNLQQGLPEITPDYCMLEKPDNSITNLLDLKVRANLTVPLRWDGTLKGVLSLFSSSPTVFPAEDIQVAQEIANMLGIAIQQKQLKDTEQQRRREAEAMRDIMSALASAGDLNQTLQSVLVNLHSVIEYDHASLYLVDENKRFVLAEKDVLVQRSAGRAFHEKNPLVDEMRQTRQPIIVSDIQGDDRFSNWPEVETVRSWMGAPLIVENEMIGFLSLGSLQPDSFGRDASERFKVFADQFAQVLERAWQNEQSQRRTEELDVLSSITLALGQAETSDNPLSAVLKQIAHFSGARNGAFLFPDRLEAELIVKASLDESVLGLKFPSRWDPIWSVYINGETTVIPDITQDTETGSLKGYENLFRGCRAAILVPVRTGAATFGVLSFGYGEGYLISNEDVRLCNAVADITAASLRRSVVLETLEKQVEIRTQHLVTLYEINAVASEPLPLDDLLKQVLKITLESMGSKAGAVHFLNDSRDILALAVETNLSPKLKRILSEISAQDNFWIRLMESTSPVVINDTSKEVNLPGEFTALREFDHQAYIGAPIRAKGQLLGILSLFDQSILDYTIEDITLFMTISDQIGGLVERAKLMKQAELAAVVQERQRLARELHDSVTQLLYSQVLFSGAGLKVLQQNDLSTTETHLDRINKAALQALKEMRLLVYQLRPSDYLEEGLAGALARRLDSVENRTGINARLVVDGELSLDEAVEIGLYRIAEEALNNTLKHSQASHVTVDLHQTQNAVTLEIIDDGIGFDLHAGRRSGGMGLESIRERTVALGGRLDIQSKPGHGTHIRVEIEVAQ